ncbi:MAG: hypothetical protein ACI97A_004229 [Planctomycetota bacterium]|jgi:hypothetical protein
MTQVNHAIIALLTLALATGPFADVRHPNHLSLAEVEYNAKTGELEVSLAVLAIDFEETLSRRAGKRINLDRTKGIKKIIEDYLAERFIITLPDGSKPRPYYAGREDKGKVVWIYFTMPLVPKKPKASSPKKHSTVDSPKKRATASPVKKHPQAPLPKILTTVSPLIGTRLENRILMELNAGQYNRVILREGKWRRQLLFEKRNQNQVLREKAPVIRKEVKKRKAPVKQRKGDKTPAEVPHQK